MSSVIFGAQNLSIGGSQRLHAISLTVVEDGWAADAHYGSGGKRNGGEHRFCQGHVRSQSSGHSSQPAQLALLPRQNCTQTR